MQWPSSWRHLPPIARRTVLKPHAAFTSAPEKTPLKTSDEKSVNEPRSFKNRRRKPGVSRHWTLVLVLVPVSDSPVWAAYATGAFINAGCVCSIRDTDLYGSTAERAMWLRLKVNWQTRDGGIQTIDGTNHGMRRKCLWNIRGKRASEESSDLAENVFDEDEINFR